MSELREAGAELRRRREALGLSLDDAYLRTRIAAAHLQALEEGNLSALPGPFYAVGFVKTYCRHLELEPTRFVHRYQAAANAMGRPRHRVKRVTRTPYRAPRHVSVSLPRWAGQAMTWAAICAIVALSWAAYSTMFKPSTDPLEGRAQAAVKMVVPPATSLLDHPQP